MKSIRKSNNDNFYKLGGLTKAEQEKYNKQIESYNSRKEEMNKKVRMFIETDLPLYMNRDLLLDAFMQNRLERQAKYPSYISEIEMFLGIDLSSVKTQLKEKVVDCKIIQGMDENEGEFCHKRHDDALLSYANVKSYVDDKLNKTDEYRLMKKLVLDNENIETINNIIEENKKIDVSILEIERSQEELNSKISSLNSELEMLYAMYERTNDELKKSSLYDSSFVLGKSTLDICMKLANVITKNKLKAVSDKALGIFNDTIRKNGFITKLEITPEFNLVLYNGQGTMIDPKTLSAGEMQIMVSSLIWAMFRVSGRREMFIFDTPLARLDEDNRYKFIAKIISTISSQVVILSTDSEFVGKNLEIIKDRIHMKYLLDYDEKAAKTTVTERLAAIPEGKSLYKNYSDAWKKSPWDKPSCTIKENHGGTNVHPKLPRCLTARELAALQSFPDDFIFKGRIVDESTLERAFMLVMQRLITADDALINKFVNRAKQALDNTLPIKSVDNIKKGIESLEVRKNKVIDLMVDGTLSKEQYQTRIDDIEKKIEEYRKELNEISLVTEKQNTLKDKLEIIKEIVSNKLTIDEFDEDVFEALIKKVVVGGLDDDGNKIHHMLTFVFSEDRKTNGYKTNYIVIDSFDMPVDFYEFVKNEYGVNKKKIINSIPIRIAVENE